MDRNDAEAVIKETIAYANNEINKERKRSRKTILAVSICAILFSLFLGSCFLSYTTFHTGNPFSAASGCFQVAILDKEYAEIQKSPKVIIAQPNDEIFINYMKSRGFKEIEEEQMGAMRVFTNGEEKEWILYSENAHWSKWRWQ